MNKKIGFVFSGDFPEGNTKNARLKLLVMELRANGWESTFLSAYPYRFSKSLNHKQPKTWEGFKIYFFSLFRKYPKIKVLRFIQVLIAHHLIILWSLFKSSRYDVLYYYNPRLSDTLLSLRINCLLGRKCIVDQTELFSSGVNKKLHLLEEKWLAKYPTVLFTISQRLYDHYSVIRKGKLYRFPIVVDAQRFDSEVDEKKFLLGYIGSFAAKDGVFLLLDALKIVSKKISDIKLRLIGHSPQVQKLEKYVNDHGLENSVEITGTVSYSEVPWLLCECDTLLMNRDQSEFSKYGYPIKLGEYLACEKPVLMSDSLGFAEDFEDKNQAYKFEINNAQSLADVILYRYNHQGESDAIAKRGYEFALDHFDSKKMGAFLTNILSEI